MCLGYNLGIYVQGQGLSQAKVKWKSCKENLLPEHNFRNLHLIFLTVNVHQNKTLSLLTLYLIETP